MRSFLFGCMILAASGCQSDTGVTPVFRAAVPLEGELSYVFGD